MEVQVDKTFNKIFKFHQLPTFILQSLIKKSPKIQQNPIKYLKVSIENLRPQKYIL